MGDRAIRAAFVLSPDRFGMLCFNMTSKDNNMII